MPAEGLLGAQVDLGPAGIARHSSHRTRPICAGWWRRPDEGLPVVSTKTLPNKHLLDPSALAIPTRLLGSSEQNVGLFGDGTASRANLSAAARAAPGVGRYVRTSVTLGARLAALLDPDEPVPGVTTGTPEPPLVAFGAIMRAGGGELAPAELAITAGWGHGGASRPIMPGQGRLTERDAYTAAEFMQIKTRRRRVVGSG